jgi:hypothetical protein
VSATRTVVGEPSPSLRQLFDLPLKNDVAQPAAQSIDALSKAARGVGNPEEWLDVYDRGIRIVESLLSDVEARVAQLQQSSLDGEDAAEIRQKYAVGPRKEAERVRADVQAQTQRVVKEWSSRAKRQSAYLIEQWTTTVNGLQVTQRSESNQVLFSVDESWLKELCVYVHRCVDEWVRTTVSGVDDALHAGVTKASTPLLVHSSGVLPSRPPLQGPPGNDGKAQLIVEGGRPKIPGIIESAFKTLRSHVMTIGILGSVVTGVALLLSRGGDDGSGNVNSMMVRGGLIVAVLPVSLVFGLVASRKQRAQQVGEALEKYKVEARSRLMAALEKTVEGQQDILERWSGTRGAQWVDAWSDWYREEVDSVLEGLEAKGNEALRDLKVNQSKISEELSSLKLFRSQVSQTLLFELRKRRRDLTE